MVDLAKRQEARTAASMGYNPYEARLMGNTVRERNKETRRELIRSESTRGREDGERKKRGKGGGVYSLHHAWP